MVLGDQKVRQATRDAPFTYLHVVCMYRATKSTPADYSVTSARLRHCAAAPPLPLPPAAATAAAAAAAAAAGAPEGGHRSKGLNIFRQHAQSGHAALTMFTL